MTGRAPITAALLLGIASAGGCSAELQRTLPASGPEAVYLTWQDDPTSTMTIRWLTRSGPGGDEISWAPGDAETWRTASGEHHPLPYTDSQVHSVELAGLEPGHDYRFRIEGDESEHRFRTMPADAEDPVTFIVGGDAYRQGYDPDIYRAAGRRDPMFVLIGGDIVYDNGDPARADRWINWLNAWDQYMVAPDGRLIPLLVAIGNHEVKSRFGGTPQEAPCFYALFPWPGTRGCGILDFGRYMSLVVLDSGHSHTVAEQAPWLAETLSARAGVPHLFVAYHVPAYPSVRPFNDGISPEIRRSWVPLFDRYGVDVAFENHEHAYKRTPLIRGGRVADDGVLYLGDGAWGSTPRIVHDAASTWYLARSESINHFIVTTIQGDTRTHEAVDAQGRVFDRY